MGLGRGRSAAVSGASGPIGRRGGEVMSTDALSLEALWRALPVVNAQAAAAVRRALPTAMVAPRIGSSSEVTVRTHAAIYSVTLLAMLASGVDAADDVPIASTPLELRLLELNLAPAEPLAAAGPASSTAKEVFWLSIRALMTFGVPLLDLPNVLRRSGEDGASAQRCRSSWKDVERESGPWLRSADVAGYVLQTVRDEVRRHGDSRAAVAELRVRMISLPCAAEFRATADVQCATAGPPEPRPNDASPAEPPLQRAAVGAEETVDIHRWAAAPELGRQALTEALTRLAREVGARACVPPTDKPDRS
jgi:hypothetical protein